jgi:hypothetical protein
MPVPASLARLTNCAQVPHPITLGMPRLDLELVLPELGSTGYHPQRLLLSKWKMKNIKWKMENEKRET